MKLRSKPRRRAERFSPRPEISKTKQSLNRKVQPRGRIASRSPPQALCSALLCSALPCPALPCSAP
eukprot:9235057-Alexandrium_andersonii.AAC.1